MTVEFGRWVKKRNAKINTLARHRLLGQIQQNFEWNWRKIIKFWIKQSQNSKIQNILKKKDRVLQYFFVFFERLFNASFRRLNDFFLKPDKYIRHRLNSNQGRPCQRFFVGYSSWRFRKSTVLYFLWNCQLDYQILQNLLVSTKKLIILVFENAQKVPKWISWNYLWLFLKAQFLPDHYLLMSNFVKLLQCAYDWQKRKRRRRKWSYRPC